jgi:hypothetical protein
MAKQRRAPKSKRRDWVARICVTRLIEVCCYDCTEEEARDDPFQFQDGGETYIETIDYDVQNVKPND